MKALRLRKVNEARLKGALHLAPYLRICPTNKLVIFKILHYYKLKRLDSFLKAMRLTKSCNKKKKKVRD